MATANPPTTHLLYLHGFRSSPRSAKAQMVASRVQALSTRPVLWSPQSPPSPREAVAQILQGIASWPHDTMAVIGSSLGGFYATCVAEATGCRAVLLNPAVEPARDLARHIGEQTAWHDPESRFFFEPRFVDELRALRCATITRPSRYFAVIAKGDELLDWREMRGRYPGAHLRLLEGGDHALTDFEDHIGEVFDFLGLPQPGTTR